MTQVKLGVGFIVKVACFRSQDLEFEPLFGAEMTSGVVDLIFHPEVGEMSTSVLVIEGTVSVAQLCPQKNDAVTGCT